MHQQKQSVCFIYLFLFKIYFILKNATIWVSVLKIVGQNCILKFNDKGNNAEMVENVRILECIQILYTGC